MNVHSIRPNTVDPTGQRAFPNIAIETKLLVDHFKNAPEGSVHTYAELEKLIGRSVHPDGSGYRYMTSAKRILLRDYDVLVDQEAKVGIKVCTNDEKIVVSGRDLKRSRRAVQRSKQKLVSVKYDRLDEQQKREWNARMSVAGALELMSAPKAVRKIEKSIADHVLPSASVLELFRS